MRRRRRHGRDLGEMVRDSRCISIQLQSRGNRALAQEGPHRSTGPRAALYNGARAGGRLAHGRTPRAEFLPGRGLGHNKAAAREGLCARRSLQARREAQAALRHRQGQAGPRRDGRDAQGVTEQLYRGFTPEELGTLMRLQKKMLANLADTEVHSILEG